MKPQNLNPNQNKNTSTQTNATKTPTGASTGNAGQFNNKTAPQGQNQSHTQQKPGAPTTHTTGTPGATKPGQGR